MILPRNGVVICSDRRTREEGQNVFYLVSYSKGDFGPVADDDSSTVQRSKQVTQLTRPNDDVIETSQTTTTLTCDESSLQRPKSPEQPIHVDKFV